MSNTTIGDERTTHCPQCDKTTDQYRYHSGEWVCVECGEETTENNDE